MRPSTGSGSGARDQVGRLLALVPYIQARQQVSVEEAAAEFGVRPAQIVKDLNVLWFCGLPGLGMGDLIEVDMDAVEGEGVIRVSNADYLRRPLRLDSSEASALIVALRALREGSTPAVRPDRGPDARQARGGRRRRRRPGRPGRAAAPGCRRRHRRASGAAARGRQRRRQVRIDYYVPARDESTARVVDPIGLVTAQGNDYLDAWCHLAEDQRLFRLDRISSAEVLETGVADHSDLRPRDLADGIFRPSPDDAQVTLLLEPEARWVAEYYPTDTTEEADAGRLRVRLRVGNPEWLVRLLLRLGSTVTVEEPAEVADRRSPDGRRRFGQLPHRARVRWRRRRREEDTMNIGPPEIILILLVLVLLFGAKKLPELARGSGRALRIFKAETKGLMDDDEDDEDESTGDKREIQTRSSSSAPEAAPPMDVPETQPRPETDR